MLDCIDALYWVQPVLYREDLVRSETEWFEDVGNCLLASPVGQSLF